MKINQKIKNEKKKKRSDISSDENNKKEENQPYTKKKRKRSKNRKKYDNYNIYLIKEIDNNSNSLNNFTNVFKHNVINVDVNSIENTNQLFFDNWKNDYKFLNGRTSFYLFERHFLGHTFSYDSSNNTEQTCFE